MCINNKDWCGEVPKKNERWVEKAVPLFLTISGNYILCELHSIPFFNDGIVRNERELNLVMEIEDVVEFISSCDRKISNKHKFVE